jgi:xylulokinase
VLIVKDFVQHQLTGAVVTDPSDAAGTAMYDQRGSCWSVDLYEAAGLRLDQLPPIKRAIDVAGPLKPSWSRSTGLRAGVPVFVGATDTAAELVSLGAIDPGSSIVKVASTGTVVAVTGKPRPHRQLLTYPHAVPDRWYTLAATNTAASAYRWLREQLLGLGQSDFHALELTAGHVPPGADGLLFLPFLAGERTPYWDETLRAAFVGISMIHGPAHFARAVMEGVALSLRTCRDLMKGLGFEVERPFLAGGGMNSRLWRQILVSTLGTSGRLADPQGPAVGAALLAATGAGIGPGAKGGHGRRLAVGQVRPRPDWLKTYSIAFTLYTRAAASMALPSQVNVKLEEGRTNNR